MAADGVAKTPVGILLAAGRGRRFDPSGQNDKLLAVLPSGVPLAVAAARNLRAALPRVIAVIRPQAVELAALLRDAGCEVVVCVDADEGMGAVLACAIQHCVDASAWLVALADMPFISHATYTKLITALAQHDLVAPEFDGRRGHPVGFARRYLDDLLSLKGEHGARQLIVQESTFLLSTNDVGVLRDIDTKADL
ncbi:MAG: nucleotidyltransferase family protein [Rhodocyclaceae bacterium]|nr:nucleotidyltransferase family protein [Rhodocyclaceae bacterium]